jgi:hypothetical protein
VQEQLRTLVARATALLLSDLDAVIKVEDTPEYSDFRQWLGGQAAQYMSSLVGKVISCSSPQPENIDLGTTYLTPTEDELRELGVKGRLSWFKDELPSLQETYKQLYAFEVPRMEHLLDSIDFLLWDTEEQREDAMKVYNELETLYMLAQPGARIMRNDREALEGYEDFMRRLAVDIAREEGKYAAVTSALTIGNDVPEDLETLQRAAHELREELNVMRSEKAQLENQLSMLNRDISLRGKRLDVLAMALEDLQ